MFGSVVIAVRGCTNGIGSTGVVQTWEKAATEEATQVGESRKKFAKQKRNTVVNFRIARNFWFHESVSF